MQQKQRNMYNRLRVNSGWRTISKTRKKIHLKNELKKRHCATKHEIVFMKLLMSPRRNALGWRIQPVLFVSPKLMNLDTGLLSLFQKKRRCGLRQTLRYCGNSRLMITSGKTRASQSLFHEEWSDLFGNTRDNITAYVNFNQSKDTGLTATKMTRNDELPRHLIPESEWPRFLQARVAEWTAILDTFAITIISPTAAKDIRKHLLHRIVPSRHVYREKPGEGDGAASKAKCQWCVLGHRDPDIRHLVRSSPTPQTSSINTFLFVAAVLQREVTLGDLKSAFPTKG